MPNMPNCLKVISRLKLYVAIGIGGVIGSSLRFLLSFLFGTNNFSAFPWATLTVNVSGAFLLTFVLFTPFIKDKISPTIFTAITTGVIGSYTTFSTITVEVILVGKENVFYAFLYLFLTICGGLLCSFIGYKVAKSLKKEAIVP
ncbi:fluoride efflux transporter FluC [Pseudogracilibacillus auburnensis]|uniref:fluoride efflux transporter FluC n=1 Tax=Pseudogracilibacillus auburnensis TaxID=1494959 RepID=UPI001A972D78|nr:CrcB family protein [Pseudogracilibacillus auburnensis]MBO1005539.1 CrcB family protein [Pseudogracilibacillus auburnensis]